MLRRYRLQVQEPMEGLMTQKGKNDIYVTIFTMLRHLCYDIYDERYLCYDVAIFIFFTFII